MTTQTLENEIMSQVEQIVGKLIPIYEAYQEGEKSLAGCHNLHAGWGEFDSRIFHNDPDVEDLEGPVSYQFYADVSYRNLFLLNRRHEFEKYWILRLGQTHLGEGEPREYRDIYTCKHFEKFTAVRKRFLDQNIQEFSVYQYKSYEPFYSEYEICTEARWDLPLPHNPLKIYAKALENWRRFQHDSPTQLTRSAQKKVWEILRKNISEREVKVPDNKEWPPKLPSMEVYGR